MIFPKKSQASEAENGGKPDAECLTPERETICLSFVTEAVNGVKMDWRHVFFYNMLFFIEYVIYYSWVMNSLNH